MFWDYPEYGAQLAVRMGKWKGVRQNLRKSPDAPLELYDLENDLGEQVNVSRDFPDVAKRVEEIMLRERDRPVVQRWEFGKYREATRTRD